MMADVIRVEGLTELKRKFDALPRAIAKKAFRGALGAAAKQARDAARSAAPMGKGPRRRGGALVPPGTLKRSALIKFDRTQSNDLQAVYLVTFRRGKKQQKGNKDAYYASWVEFGHKIVPRKSKKSGATIRARRRGYTGTVEGRRFLTNSFISGQQRYLSTFVSVATSKFAEAVK